MTVAEVTVGRMVYYRPCNADNLNVSLEPLSAQVAAVHDGGKAVNVCVLDHEGRTHAKQRVPFVQPGETPPKVSYCEWMPYQVGQAKKTEEAEAKLAEAAKSDDKPAPKYGRK
jgi:hypothetical protein